MLLLLSVDSFSKILISKKYFKNAIRVSYGSNQVQNWRSVSPDLDPNCLQSLTEQRSPLATKELTSLLTF